MYIRISDSELSFAHYEASEPQNFQFATFPVRPQVSLMVNLRTALQQVTFLPQSARHTEVLVNTPVTPVPLAEFQEEDIETLFHSCIATEGKQRVFYDSVPALNAVLLYALGESVCSSLEEVFGTVHYTSSQTPLLQHFAKKGLDTTAGRRVFVYRHDNQVHIIVLEANRLVTQNAYRAISPADVEYYLFNTMQHLALSAASTPIFVAGDASLRAPLEEDLKKYASRVYAVNPAAEFNRSRVATTEGVPYDLMCALLR